MASYIRAIASLPCGNALPEDTVQNTFHFRFPGSYTLLDLAALGDEVEDFYQEIDAYLAAQYGPTLTVDWYDMSQPEPRPPVLTTTYTLVMGAGQSLPAEVALCISYQGDRLAGASQARRRGRLYFGPLDSDFNTTVNFVTRPNSTIISAFATAAANLLAAVEALGLQWNVYSPTNFAATGELNAAFTQITNGWVDNSFDTQRRRGSDPTSRTTWT